MTETYTAQEIAQMRAEVLAFAREFGTPAVRRAVRLAEQGRLTWADLYTQFTNALGVALSEVKREF